MRPLALAASVVLLAACGASGTPGTPSPAATPGPTASPATTPTATPTPTEGASPTPSAAATGEIGTIFVDPEGGYVIEIDPAWTEAPAGMVAQGIEIWFVAPVEDGFAPNVNLLTQASGGMDLTAYLDLSIQNAPSFIDDFELVASKEIEGQSVRLGRLEYTGVAAGRSLHFLAIVAIADSTAIVATLTAPPESFAALRAAVEPFLLTLTPS